MKPFLFTLFADAPFEKMASSSLRLIARHTVTRQLSPASLSIRSTKHVILVFGDICVTAPTRDCIVRTGGELGQPGEVDKKVNCLPRLRKGVVA
jgi:hypothetical protein